MISVFEIYKIGIGPSSSHTVGPMKAANYFINELIEKGLLEKTTRVYCELFGSLGATGKGHASDSAVLLGLTGEQPETVDTNHINDRLADIHKTKQLMLAGKKTIAFNDETDILLYKNKFLSYHPNALTFSAYQQDVVILQSTYYSVGGGFIVSEAERTNKDKLIMATSHEIPYPFSSAQELLEQCRAHQLKISDIMLANENCIYSETEIFAQLKNIWTVMQDCVLQGCVREGVLPGGLGVKRRAPGLYRQLMSERAQPQSNIALYEMDWVNLYAMAVNEENAAGGRVVTAPTNGAAGIIPATLHYYRDFATDFTEEKVYRFLLTAAAIGIIIKQNASISGAEIGCQGEVGSACAMAAAGLTEVFGGSPALCANAAEIGIEHNLGLTCDPIAGLVQVPCIERNAMGAVKAINASRIARRGNGQHFVSLDKAILTMRETGKDMLEKYKETAQGGLAINAIEIPVNFVDC